MTFNIPVTTQKVKQILENHPESRDDDCVLLAEIWKDEIERSTDAVAFLSLLSEGKLTHFETASRVRRKIQERSPALRGEKYHSRHKAQQTFLNQLKFAW